MAINISKKNGNYYIENFQNNVTVLTEENLGRMSQGLVEVSEKLKNSIASMDVFTTDWEASGSDFKVVVNHNFNTEKIVYKLYRVVGSVLEEEECWSKIITETQFEIYNDEKINGQLTVCFDVLS